MKLYCKDSFSAVFRVTYYEERLRKRIMDCRYRLQENINSLGKIMFNNEALGFFY